MKCAIIRAITYNENCENEYTKLQVTNIIEVTNQTSMNDSRINFEGLYAVAVDGNVKVGMIYDPDKNTISDETGSVVYPPVSAAQEIATLTDVIKELTYNVDEDKLTLDELKEYLIKKNKKNLSEYLYDHPMTYNDKQYTITEEKQNQLTGVLNAYNYAKAIGVDIPLTWNETGGLCESYTCEQLVAIYLQMLNVVKPIVTYQQEHEIEIRNAKTKEEALAVDITFDNYNAINKETGITDTDNTNTEDKE